jgi:xylulokinase
MSLLGLDIGSTGTKGIVFREDGKVIAEAHREYPMRFPKPGWVEIDANSMWDKVLDLIMELNAKLASKSPAGLAKGSVHDPVTALSVSTFGEAFTPVDKTGRILSDTIYPLDSRGTDELARVMEDFGEDYLYETTGVVPSYLYSLSKLIWVKDHAPDVYGKADKFLFNEDMLFRRLGLADTKVSYSLSSRTMFFDLKEKSWSSKILDRYGIAPDRFSPPAPSGEIVGEIPKKKGAELGFVKPVILVSGGHDQPCAALGAGSVREGTAADGVGTVECIIPAFEGIRMNDRMKKNGFCCEPGALSGWYVTLAYNMTAGSVLGWFRNTIGFQVERRSKQEGADFYDYAFSRMVYKPSKVHAFPYFGASGTPHFHPRALGAFVGLSLGTEGRELLQSMIEGLTFEMKYNLELLGESGIRTSELRAIGGGAKSDFWLQLKANLLGIPIYRMEVEEAGCLAAIMLAGVATSVFPSCAEAADRFAKIKREFHPKRDNLDLYLAKYEKYKKMYALIKDFL